MFKQISKAVWLLSLVSLFTDAASEMLYPVMPAYLKSIGFSVLLIGVLEGIAEAVAGWSKGFFGHLSDYHGKRLPFVQFGYSLSAISKPLMVIWNNAYWVFLMRSTDRMGKGIRTGARDAILSAEATPETKARIFGFHRSMDTFGAVIGPCMALLYLYFFSEDYTTLFLLATIPGIAAIGCTILIKEKINNPNKTVSPSFTSFLSYWKTSSKTYKRMVTGLLFFALINSSDFFLLMHAKESGLTDVQVIGVYIFYNLVYALFAFPLGKLADKIGLQNMLLSGLLIFAIVYFGMGFIKHGLAIGILFMLYGIYAAATDGISKAWISNLSAKEDTATAIGFYSAWQSICAIFASTCMGLIWFQFGAQTAFIFTGIGTLSIIGYFLFIGSLKSGVLVK